MRAILCCASLGLLLGCTRTTALMPERGPLVVRLAMDSSISVLSVWSKAGLFVDIPGPIQDTEVAAGRVEFQYSCLADATRFERRATFEGISSGTYRISCSSDGSLVWTPSSDT
jgi:hypothetical protein